MSLCDTRMVTSLVAWFLLLFLGAHVHASGVLSPDRLGWLEYRGGLRVLHLKGTPYEMGYQHGILLRKDLAYLQTLVDPVASEDASWPERLRDFFTDLYHRTFVLGRIKRDIPVAYLDEMRGIVAGSGGEIDFDSLLMLQLFFEAMGPSGSAFVALPGATSPPMVFHGRNLDISLVDKLRDLVTVVVYEPTQGRKFASVGWPGLVGVVQGMNDAGMSLSYSSVALDDDKRAFPGTPGLILAREALQHATNPEEVYMTFSGWPRSTGAAVVVADAANDAAVIEFSPTRIASRKPDGGLLYATTYFASPALLPLSRSRLVTGGPKFGRLGSLLEAMKGKIDLSGVMSVLLDGNGTGGEQEDRLLHNHFTVTSVVFEPKQLRFWVARSYGAATTYRHTYNYVPFDLLQELVGAGTDPVRSALVILGQMPQNV